MRVDEGGDVVLKRSRCLVKKSEVASLRFSFWAARCSTRSRLLSPCMTRWIICIMLDVLSPREENGSDEDSVPMLCREEASLACATLLESTPPSKTRAEIFNAERKKLAIKLLLL